MAKNSIKSLNKLPIGAIRPTGWLLDQLNLTNELQKRLGASKAMLKDGEWTGGETFPRYVRGLVLLAGVLDDKNLRSRADSFMLPIFASANEGGDFGPNDGRFISPKIEAVKTILSYYEMTGDEESLAFLRKYFKNQFNTFDITPCWYHSRARLLEEIPAIETVFRETDSEWLHDLAEKLREKSTDWFKLGNVFKYKKPSTRYLNNIAAKKLRKQIEEYESGADSLKPLTVERADAQWKKRSHQIAVETSGVSLAKAVKYPCTYGRFVGDNDLKEISLRLIANLSRYHSGATGMFSSDYRLAGISPTRGIDVESSVEMIESLVDVLAQTSEIACADLIEQIAFNIIPAAAFDDLSAVQDIIVPNQEEASVQRSLFKESEFGNAYVSKRLSRGAVSIISAFPLFMQSLCMTREKELNFFSYAPCIIDTVVSGSRIRIKQETGYPFRNTIIFKVEEAEGDPEIKINFRVPRHTAMQLISGGQVVATGTKSISVKCVLKTGSTFMLKLDIPLIVTDNKDGSLSMSKGSILMASKFADSITQSPSDRHVFNVNFAKKWNFAPIADKRNSGGIHRLFDSEQTIVNPIGNVPFSHDKPPFELRIRSKNVMNWDYNMDGTPQIPKKPEFSEESIERVYVPFGCTSVRMCHFPPCFKG